MAVVDHRVSEGFREEEQRSFWRRITNQPPGRLLLLPALIYVIIFTQIPFLYTIWYSFQRWNLQRPDARGFIGLQNYQTIFTRDQAFRDALVNTVVFTVASVIFALIVGLFFAELVNHRFPGRGIVRTLLITPFLIMPAAAALSWKNLIYNPNFGVLDWFTRTFLPGDIAPNWLGQYPRLSIIIFLVWRWAPFMMLILLAGMGSISEEVREAARVDGANAWQEFRSITLPHLYRFFQLGGLLGVIYIFQDFDPIFMMTQGGPGSASTNLSYLVYRRAIQNFNIGQSAALGVVIVFISIIVVTFLIRALTRLFEGELADGRREA